MPSNHPSISPHTDELLVLSATCALHSVLDHPQHVPNLGRMFVQPFLSFRRSKLLTSVEISFILMNCNSGKNWKLTWYGKIIFHYMCFKWVLTALDNISTSGARDRKSTWKSRRNGISMNICFINAFKTLSIQFKQTQKSDFSPNKIFHQYC